MSNPSITMLSDSEKEAWLNGFFTSMILEEEPDLKNSQFIAYLKNILEDICTDNGIDYRAKEAEFRVFFEEMSNWCDKARFR